jgi:hypothetical protein
MTKWRVSDLIILPFLRVSCYYLYAKEKIRVFSCT